MLVVNKGVQVGLGLVLTLRQFLVYFCPKPTLGQTLVMSKPKCLTSLFNTSRYGTGTGGAGHYGLASQDTCCRGGTRFSDHHDSEKLESKCLQGVITCLQFKIWAKTANQKPRYTSESLVELRQMSISVESGHKKNFVGAQFWSKLSQNDIHIYLRLFPQYG